MATVTVLSAPGARPSVGLSQQSVIFAVLFIGFIVFLLIRGKLAAYVNLLFGTKAKAASTVSTSQTNTNLSGGGMAPGGTGTATDTLLSGGGISSPSPTNDTPSSGNSVGAEGGLFDVEQYESPSLSGTNTPLSTGLGSGGTGHPVYIDVGGDAN
jgi:hypothetical protein